MPTLGVRMRWCRINFALSGALAGILSLACTSMALADDQPAMPLENSSLQQLLTQSPFVQIGTELVEMFEIREFYKIRGFKPIWTNELSAAFKNYIENINRHGLNPGDYVIPTNLGPRETEILTTERFLRVAQNIAGGRFDPDQIDFDIKFKRKLLNGADHLMLAKSLEQDGNSLTAALDSLAPQIPAYRDLMTSLQELNQRKARGLSYTHLKFPGSDLHVGAVNSSTVPQLRQALIDRGYDVTPNLTKYDHELETMVRIFQIENGLEVNSNLLPQSEIWRALSFNIDQRIRQIEVNMEKLRWLPRNLEPKHIFINIAFSEFQLMDKGQAILEMKTVNGRPTWRTPSMRDLLVGVILNPTWTAPDSIVTQIKLPEILKNSDWLEENRIHLKDKATGVEIDPSTVDWKSEGVNIARRALFIQDPGPKNSLGVVKFPLAINRDDVYMHDTNERDFFVRAMRQLSSGCIRLEKPIELAKFLLQGTEYTAEKIDQLLAKGTQDEVYDPNIRVNLPRDQWIPVYTLYLTTERSKSGRLRFATDYYGQDSRVAAAITQSHNRQDGLAP